MSTQRDVPVGRKLSRGISLMGQHLDAAIDDCASFLDVQGNLQSRVEVDGVVDQRAAADGRAACPPGGAPVGDRPEEPVALRKPSTTQQMGEQLLDPKRVVFRDKVVFFLGVLNVGLIGFWMGRSPATYHHFWALKCAVLFTLRFVTYRQKGQHWLLLELCYAGNLLGLAHLYAYPHSPAMRKLAFAVMSGPLMFSILAMRNSLVFHDYERTTTLMMHASPAIVAWAMRWHPDPAWAAGVPAAARADYDVATWRDMLQGPLAFYLAWVLSYYLLTFVVLRSRIEGRGRETMYSLMVPRDAAKARRSPLARTVLRAPPALRPVAYLACHAVAATLALLPTKLFWNHFWFHTAALLVCLGMSVWNGGSYYFAVFAKKYLAQLEAAAQGKRLATTSDKEA